jgi:RNA recognition motif-containing protein
MHEFAKYPCRLNDFRFYIEELNRNLQEDGLKTYFDTIGEVIDVYIINSEDLKRRKAFITFSHYHDIRPGKEHKIFGYDVNLEACYSIEEEPSTTIALTGETTDITVDSIRKYFSAFGTITDFRRQINRKTNKLSQFIFIQFDKPEAVQVVIDKSPHLIEDVDVDIIRVESP